MKTGEGPANQPLADQTSLHAVDRRQFTIDEYFSGVRSGDLAMLARALTLVESTNPQSQIEAEELLTRMLPHTGSAIRVGITGAPGVGKSTFIEALGLELIRRGKRVAVLAVDPSSGISGGSILGDKTRMPELAAERAAFIRPSPAAGTLGGVAHRTRESMLVCEAARYDVVLIETVGVGQSETLVADIADCFVALMIPGAGDELQGIKRGLLEYVDVIVVNKADGATRQAAEMAARQYALALKALSAWDREAPAILTASALEQRGIGPIWDEIEARHARMNASGDLTARRRRQSLRWLWSIVEDRLRKAVHTHPAVKAIRDRLELEVLDGTLPPEAAARRVLEAFGIR